MDYSLWHKLVAWRNEALQAGDRPKAVRIQRYIDRTKFTKPPEPPRNRTGVNR